MLNTPFSPWPSYSSAEAEIVSRVLASNRVNAWTGGECAAFEREFAVATGVPHAVGLMNGTVALEAAFRALRLGPGDEVIVTPRTFVASASSIVAVGATPVFADVDPDSQNITAESCARVLSARTRAILCVHLAGWACEMSALRELAGAHDLALVEDCAQAHGARYRGQSVGSLGEVAAWSFCQDKIMTTGGEGGMITTANDSLWQRAWSYKDHGKSHEAVHRKTHSSGFRWLHESFGTNYRMLEMQAALGRYQLRCLADWHALRDSNARRILAECSECSALRVPLPPDHVEHAWYRAYAFIRPEALRSDWSRDRILCEINASGVPCFVGSCSEVYLERAFDGTGLRPEKPLPVAAQLGATSLMFLVHPTLTEAEIATTTQSIRAVMDRATR